LVALSIFLSLLEEEPGSAGKDQVDFCRRKVLRGCDVESIRPTGDKVDRAGPLASAVEAGNALLVDGKLGLLASFVGSVATE
jgi:phage terminase large subunit-like protein